MDPIIISALISFIGGIISTASTRSGQDRTLDENRRNMALQHQYNKDMAQMQYELTRPQTQAADLRSVGVSEAAIAQALSGANVGAFSSSASPVSDMGAPIGNNIAQITSSLGNLLSGQASTRNAATNEMVGRSTVILNEFQCKKMDAEARKLVIDGAYTQQQYDFMKEMQPLMIGKTKAEIDNIIQQGQNLAMEYFNIIAKYNEIQSTIGKNNAQAALAYEQANTETFKQDNLAADTNKKDKESIDAEMHAFNLRVRNYLLYNFGVTPEGAQGLLGAMAKFGADTHDMGLGWTGLTTTWQNFNRGLQLFQATNNLSKKYGKRLYDTSGFYNPEHQPLYVPAN